MQIAIINYDMGNIYSIKSAFEYCGAKIILTHDYHEIKKADKLILPGVGSFKKAMHNINKLELDKILDEIVIQDKKPILGICLGMQLLAKSSQEDGFTKGLNYFDGHVEKIDSLNNTLRIPHVGFNEVTFDNESSLFRNIGQKSDFYFTHSYRLKSNITQNIATCTYGDKFVVGFEKMNIYGVQFHPEKSQRNGLELIRNFITSHL